MPFRRVLHSDPTAFVTVYGMWGVINGVCLILPVSNFPSLMHYALMRMMIPYGDGAVWGLIMLFAGMMLFACLRIRSIPMRCAIVGGNSLLWMFVGVMMVLDGIRGDTFSIPGVYSIWGSVCCFMAIEQWARFRDT